MLSPKNHAIIINENYKILSTNLKKFVESQQKEIENYEYILISENRKIYIIFVNFCSFSVELAEPALTYSRAWCKINRPNMHLRGDRR